MYYLGPTVFITAFSSFLGFCASSALLAEADRERGYISLLSGFLGVAATIISSLRNGAKMDIKVLFLEGSTFMSNLFLLTFFSRPRLIFFFWRPIVFVVVSRRKCSAEQQVNTA